MNKTIVRREAAEVQPLLASGLHPVLARVLSQRGVRNDVELDCRLQGLASFQSLMGIDSAAERIGQAIIQQQSVLVVGDFDADGATSSALAVRALRALGARRVNFLVPNRFEFGYGLTPPLVEVAQTDFSPDLLITVDNGISSNEGVSAANALGMDVVVTDHHLPGEVLPDAVAIVNPNQRGCAFPSKHLAGVGVIFYVMVAVCRYLQGQQWFDDKPYDTPNMAQFLDLVALGTVADVVPLDHNNRILVQQGLARIRSGHCCPGITALLQLAKRQARWLVSQDLGFAVGPRLNAAGRLQDMGVGIECLLADSETEALAKAQVLHELNQERRDIEADMQAEALSYLDSIELEKVPAGICLYQPHWHQGVIGILAGRLKERFARPTVVFASVNDPESVNGSESVSGSESGTELKGSLRSVAGVHIRDVLADIDAENPELMKAFGGHAMAAGVTIAAAQFEQFKACFEARLETIMTPDKLQQVLLSDGEVEAEFLNSDVAETLRAAMPWGQHFEEPLFEGVFTIVRQKWLGDKHIKLFLAGQETGALVDAIAFNQERSVWDGISGKIRVLYKMDINDYQNRRQLQLVVQHVEEYRES